MMPSAVPPNATEESWQRLPDFFDEQNEGRRRWHWRFDTPEKYQKNVKAYYRMITGLDRVMGRVLADLVRYRPVTAFRPRLGRQHDRHYGHAGKQFLFLEKCGHGPNIHDIPGAFKHGISLFTVFRLNLFR